ncbi:hypothetical protein RND71_011974 [Anisodus tanguticus]|uniref:Uncharacterized protein n=1 Tax=Anisodus tanguticus TaxID=243964 RepID=A0AAE1VGJ4_9SOLA|nr:hypothetical protein RND71_011974 [Anisodus tanguticus]
MSNYLTSGKRTRLAILSSSLKVWLLLKVARGFTKGTFELKPLTVDTDYKDEREASISLLRPTEGGFHPLGKKSPSSPSKNLIVESDLTSFKNHLYRPRFAMHIQI